MTPEARQDLREIINARQFPRILYLGNHPDPQKRPQLLLSEADSIAFGNTAGTAAQTTVTDQTTGKRFVVRHGSCGVPRCLCAAFIVKEVV
jgi:hypothetical protein